AIIVVVAFFGAGPASLPGLAVLLPAAAGLVLLLVYAAPATLAVLAPVALPLGALGSVFPYELVFGLLAALVCLQGLRSGGSWMRTIQPLEVALLGFTGWA